MTPEEEICSLLKQLEADQSLSGWPLRELSQLGMNASRKLTVNSDIVYLFFLQLNVSQRKSIPSYLGMLYIRKQKLFLKKPVIDKQLAEFVLICPAFGKFISRF